MSEPLSGHLLTMETADWVELPVGDVTRVGFAVSPLVSEETGVLYADFRRGSRYAYLHVPTETWLEIRELAVTGGSVGVFLHQNLRGVYETERLEQP